jgi:hypothetical protein
VAARLQHRISIGRSARARTAADYNLITTPNYTIETTESSSQFNQPILGENRRAQFGFRLTF